MGKYQAYAKYKSSGVEWLEDIPETWEVKRTKAMFGLTRQLVGEKSNEYQLLSLTLRGVIPRDISDGGGKIPAEFDTYQVVRPKNLIFCLFDIDETPRTIGISSNNGMITGAYNVYSCLEVCVPDYAYYYFMHIDSFKGLKPFYTGLRKVVRAETFSNIKMPAPSLIEQQKIANFLDHETAKIDTLIEKQQQLIKLLKEKRQAVISHAVTKGLNPNAPMRDSGVEWLGEVPEHWSEKRLGYLAKQERAAFVDGPFGSDLKSSDYIESGIPLIQLNNIRDNTHIIRNMKFITEDKKQQLRRHLAIPGDIVIAKMADPVARAAAVVNDYPEYIIVADCVKLSPNRNLVNLEYLVWAINCDYVRINAELVSTGTTRIRISLGELKKLKVPFPPYDEQLRIAEFLNKKKEKFEIIELKAEKQVSLLRERRTALISAAVTGKIDVRNWTAPEPSNTANNNKEVAA
jgi:type I restriction enzyme S subunit